MSKFLVQFTTEDLLDRHLAPYEKVFTFSTDAEVSRAARIWIARILGLGHVNLASHHADHTDVLYFDEKVGEITFILLDEESTNHQTGGQCFD